MSRNSGADRSAKNGGNKKKRKRVKKPSVVVKTYYCLSCCRTTPRAEVKRTKRCGHCNSPATGYKQKETSWDRRRW